MSFFAYANALALPENRRRFLKTSGALLS